MSTPIGKIVSNITNVSNCKELRLYDTLIEINGRIIFQEYHDSVARILQGVKPGAVVELLIERGGSVVACAGERERERERERETDRERERERERERKRERESWERRIEGRLKWLQPFLGFGERIVRVCRLSSFLYMFQWEECRESTLHS